MRFCNISEIPKTFIVNGESWGISFKRVIENEKETLGLADSMKRMITIKLGQTKEDTMKTLIHELLHAIEYEYDIDIEHEVIDLFEEGIFDLIVENL